MKGNMIKMDEITLSLLLLIITSVKLISGHYNNDRVLLRDLNVLTLYHGKTTSARRSSPIPQLKCVGGTAGCSTFVPQVVQCYNRGTDGFDVQWECKTDMDNAYRFGKVEVSCEGYDYPDDPYVLRGSCGLEYTLDYTKEGFQQRRKGNHDYYGNDHSSHSYSPYGGMKKKGSWFGDIIFLAIIGGVAYAIYRTCVANVVDGYVDDDGNGNPRAQSHHGSRPPPPGFRQEYMPGEGCSSTYDNTYTHNRHHGMGARTGFGGGNFWTGAATGGLLGYMFGSRTNTGYHQPHYQPRNSWGSGWGSGWGSSSSAFGSSGWGSGSSWGGGGHSSMGSSGTRTASGFGGTTRR